MSITQPLKPPDIEATTWHAIGATCILKFLVPLRGSYLYYSVMGADPDENGSKIDQARAKSVDRILDLQAAEFLAQSSRNFGNLNQNEIYNTMLVYLISWILE
jgi:hypothetical protein